MPECVLSNNCCSSTLLHVAAGTANRRNCCFVGYLGTFALQTANALGRMLVGILAAKFKHSVPLPTWYAVASVTMAAGVATLLIPSATALYFVCGVCGLAYGMFWTLNPTLAAEISGLKHLGSNYAFLRQVIHIHELIQE